MKTKCNGALHDSVGSSQAVQSQIKPQTTRKYDYSMSKSEGAQGATNVPDSSPADKPVDLHPGARFRDEKPAWEAESRPRDAGDDYQEPIEKYRQIESKLAGRVLSIEEIRERLKLAGASKAALQEAQAAMAQEAKDEAIAELLPPIDDGAAIMQAKIVEPPQLINGIVHKGLKMELAGASKTMKSWLQLQTCICIATGHEWLGREVIRAGACFLNLEVPKWHFDARVQAMVKALGVTLEPGMFKSWSLRGVDLSGDALWNAAAAKIAKIQTLGIVTVDPLYKLCNEHRSENDQGAMTTLMKRFDLLAEQTGATTDFSHHYAKGSPVNKEAIDRFSGSGVLVRDPDVYIAMTPHDEKDAFTLEFALRCLPPIEPFVIRYNYPLFELAGDLDPKKLRQPPGKKSKYTVDDLVEQLGRDDLGAAAFFKRCHQETGMCSSTFYALLDKGEAEGRLFKSTTDSKWEVVQKPKKGGR
jgi:AAA domain